MCEISETSLSLTTKHWSPLYGVETRLYVDVSGTYNNLVSYFSTSILFNVITHSKQKINSTTCIELLPTNTRQLQQSPLVQINAI